jgi:hypothetical protein
VWFGGGGGGGGGAPPTCYLNQKITKLLFLTFKKEKNVKYIFSSLKNTSMLQFFFKVK